MFLLSIGHYPQAPGATNGEHTEHSIASTWVKRIVEILQGDGFPIDTVPTGHLPSKVDFINTYAGVQFTAELHFNGNIDGAHGCESLYYPGSTQGKRFADIVLEEFDKRDIFQPNRGSKEAWYKMDKPGVVDYAGDVDGDETIDYFVRKTAIPAIIIEPEFMSNLDLIMHEQFYNGCDAIAQAVRRFSEYLEAIKNETDQ